MILNPFWFWCPLPQLNAMDCMQRKALEHQRLETWNAQSTQNLLQIKIRFFGHVLLPCSFLFFNGSFHRIRVRLQKKIFPGAQKWQTMILISSQCVPPTSSIKLRKRMDWAKWPVYVARAFHHILDLLTKSLEIFLRIIQHKLATHQHDKYPPSSNWRTILLPCFQVVRCFTSNAKSLTSYDLNCQWSTMLKSRHGSRINHATSYLVSQVLWSIDTAQKIEPSRTESIQETPGADSLWSPTLSRSPEQSPKRSRERQSEMDQ